MQGKEATNGRALPKGLGQQVHRHHGTTRQGAHPDLQNVTNLANRVCVINRPGVAGAVL